MTDFPTYHELSNAQIQEEFTKAYDTLIEVQQATTNIVMLAKLGVVSNLILQVKLLSNSWNEIPGLRGQGLEPTLLVAQQINAGVSFDSRDFTVHAHRVATGIQLTAI